MQMGNSAWSDSYGTKIVLKCKQILQFKHLKRKDGKNINKVQISVHLVLYMEH